LLVWIDADREPTLQPFADGRAQIVATLGGRIHTQLLGQRIGVGKRFNHKARWRMLGFTKG
jgi:hypothetical protein